MHVVCDEIDFDEAMEIVAMLLKYGAGAMMPATNQARSVMCDILSFEGWVGCSTARRRCNHLPDGSHEVTSLS